MATVAAPRPSRPAADATVPLFGFVRLGPRSMVNPLPEDGSRSSRGSTDSSQAHAQPEPRGAPRDVSPSSIGRGGARNIRGPVIAVTTALSTPGMSAAGSIAGAERSG